MDKSENPFHPYQLQFTAQERKNMLAEMMRELRKFKGYQQKEVASLLKISPQTYNGYETGRNEPATETLVRLSFLYDIPLDMLVQRDRLHKDNESAMLTLSKFVDEIKSIKKEFCESPLAENAQLSSLIEALTGTSDALKVLIEKSEKDNSKT